MHDIKLTPFLFLKLAVSILGGFLIYMMGQENLSAFSAVVALGFLDSLTALYVLAKKNKPLKSKKLFDKPKKLAVYAVVIMAMHLLTSINEKFAILVDAAIIWAAASEAVSILEHLATLGYKIPIPLLNSLQKDFEIPTYEMVGEEAKSEINS